MKLRRLRDDPAQCHDAIKRAPMNVEWLPDRRMGDFCAFDTVVAITPSTVRWSPAVRVTCAMAAALHVWEREVVAPAALRHFNAGITRIDHVGTYACRRVNDGSASPSARPSQHATANAIDVSAFHLADGRRISIARDWSGAPAERAFLREVRDGGCRLFRAVLSPDYNALHADHFHLDMGPYTSAWRMRLT